jgi:regulation of enolase protein 1 (concanavalin A-like superfamily)
MVGVSELTIPALPFPLSPHGAKPCTSVYEPKRGALKVRAQAGTDLFIDPAGGSSDGGSSSDGGNEVNGDDGSNVDHGERPDAGYLLGMPPPGDFAFSARVKVPFTDMFDAGVLLVFAGPERYAKLCFEYSAQKLPMAVSVVTRGVSDDANGSVVDGDTLWMRVTRTGRAWAFHVSRDGHGWDLLRYFTLTEPEESSNASSDGASPRIGFLAQSPTGPGLEVTFSQIVFRPEVPANLRDGS